MIITLIVALEVLSAAVQAQAPPPASPALEALLNEGFALRDQHHPKESRERFDRALALAQNESSPRAEAEAHRGIGLLLMDGAQYPPARTALETALEKFVAVDDHAAIAKVHLHLGALSGSMGNRADAVRFDETALSEYRTLGDLHGQADALVNLVYAEGLDPDRRVAYRNEGLEIARTTHDRLLEGRFLHNFGDTLYTSGKYVDALEQLQAAAACFEEVRAQQDLGRVLTSLGRLYRVQGAYEQALRSYERAEHIQQEIGDQAGVIQSLNAEGVAYGQMGKEKEAIVLYSRALALARRTGSPRTIAFMSGNLGGAYLDAGRYDRSIRLLRQSLALDPLSTYAGNRYAQLSEAYRSAGQFDLALDSARQAVELTRKNGVTEMLPSVLQDRATAHEKLGQYGAALSDIQEGITEFEKLRRSLLPADYLKRGFSDHWQDLFNDAIRVASEMGHTSQAMVVAEQARARAFLDLLAARNVEGARADRSAPIALTTRGELARLEGPASPISAPPPTRDEMRAVARRTNSTIVSYWVGPDATYVWALGPDGRVHAAHVRITLERLNRLVRATWSTGDESDSVRERTALRGLQLRGGGEITIDDAAANRAWHQLYALLVQPVRATLPPRGGRLMIVPHGPLFALSFGALLDNRGRYLIEDYAVTYTRSIGVLLAADTRSEQIKSLPPRYLFVAEPNRSPQDAALPPLPGARLEVEAVTRLLPSAETATLIAGAASKDAVRARAPGTRVLHFATHAIVRADAPFDSYLVLGPGPSAAGDSRLTAEEIYGLDLKADLVVLSACRTALGKTSGDGVVGLARAFFAAGASSVMATLWDVADEPTSLLILDFYTALQKGQDKSQALRTAQLHLLRELRAGRVNVTTVAGTLTLPESPVFWAPFVLQGEP